MCVCVYMFVSTCSYVNFRRVGGCSGNYKCVRASPRAHINVVGCAELSGICFSVDGEAGFHVATLNCCQFINEDGSKQWTWCDDKHE